MITKGTKLYSVVHQKCPRCQQGDMFKYSAFSTRFTEMNKKCPVCELDFIKEPSFYFGAMYFSYAFQVAVIVAVYIALRFAIDPGSWTYVIAMMSAVVLIVPFNFRWSRVAWINVFESFGHGAVTK
jgi:uncharacterized protein (DUF983 family)